MQLQQVTVNSRKYDLSIRRSWQCGLLRQSGNLLVLVGEFDRDVEHAGLGSIQRGTTSYEYYWLDRWYNIFRFHDPNGEFRNFYCNISMPAVFENGVLDYVDLDIDVLVWPDSSYEILDKEEYEENVIKFGYAQDTRFNAATALADIISAIENNKLPLPD
jgi:protein associated with RNAse G/E